MLSFTLLFSRSEAEDSLCTTVTTLPRPRPLGLVLVLLLLLLLLLVLLLLLLLLLQLLLLLLALSMRKHPKTSLRGPFGRPSRPAISVDSLNRGIHKNVNP